MTFDDLQQLVKRIHTPARRLRIGQLGDGHFLQVVFEADGQTWHGRKWYVSAYSEDNEVCQTALKALLTSLEHEAREHFTVDGKAIYAPHYDLEFLLANHDRQTHRKPVGASLDDIPP